MEGCKHHAAAIEPVTQHTSGKVARGATDVERGGDRSGRRWREAAILREEEGEPEHEAVAHDLHAHPRSAAPQGDCERGVP